MTRMQAFTILKFFGILIINAAVMKVSQSFILSTRNFGHLKRNLFSSRHFQYNVQSFKTSMASTDFVTDVESTKNALVNLISATKSGNNINPISGEIMNTINQLSSTQNPEIFATDALVGEWELLYTDDDITRSSPFFWAFRKAFLGIEDPIKILGPKMLSESIFKITDNIPFKTIGSASQIITSGLDSKSGILQSKVVVKITPVGQSTMSTSCKWRLTNEPNVIELEVEKTEILESNLLNNLVGRFVPKQIMDVVTAFPSGAALELIK